MPPKVKDSGAHTAARGRATRAGAKRGRDGEDTGSSVEVKVKRERGNEVNAAGFQGVELPDASLGNGPVWELKNACLRSAAKRGSSSQGHQSRMARGLLDQALACDRKTDMRFELDDGTTVGGHKSILSIASEGLGAMFESGMEEGRSGVVRLRGFKGSAVKGLLEWVYLGHAGQNCEQADGRELWVLAEMYDVPGVREWLVRESIDFENFCAACEFSLLPEGDRRELIAACQDFAGGIEPDYLKENIKQKGLVGVGSKAMRVLLEAVMKEAMDSEEEEEEEEFVGEEGLVARISSGFRFLHRWWTANGGKPGCEPGDGVDELVALLELGKLPWTDLRNDVRFSGLVTSHQMNELYEKKLAEADDKIDEMDQGWSRTRECLRRKTVQSNTSSFNPKLALLQKRNILLGTAQVSPIKPKPNGAVRLLQLGGTVRPAGFKPGESTSLRLGSPLTRTETALHIANMPENRFFGSKDYNVDWPSNPTQALVLAIESAGTALYRERTLDMNDAVANTAPEDFRREAGRRKKRWLKKMSAKFSEIIVSNAKARVQANPGDMQVPRNRPGINPPRPAAAAAQHRPIALQSPARPPARPEARPSPRPPAPPPARNAQAQPSRRDHARPASQLLANRAPPHQHAPAPPANRAPPRRHAPAPPVNRNPLAPPVNRNLGPTGSFKTRITSFGKSRMRTHGSLRR